MTLAEFIAHTSRYTRAHPDQRVGQAAWNALYELRYDLSSEVPDHSDAYYDDALLPHFWQWVSDHWGD